MEFHGDIPNYTTSDGSVKIRKESEVRLKIIGTRVDATEIALIRLSEFLVMRTPNMLFILYGHRMFKFQFCIGTIKDDFLGVINDPGAAA
ncbi:hypothetical protein IFM89_000123 [Coptis chinensis]|uniref:Uncharacterized protein n=1 Tax=Coptis chinensis TaxID=261450 RepID=A0A835HZT0_9MAGN|nr:hypothetical protein IFM89_000123 [Coptis chinensis]